jgi:PhnB protein
MPDLPQMPALAPHIVCDGAAEAIEFYKAAFGAEEMMKLPGPDGRLMHASIIINGAVVMMVDENKQFGMLGPKALGGTPVTLHLSVANADEAIARAEQAGATVKMPAADMFWGDRYGMVEDPWGHNWSIAHPLANRPQGEEELREAAKDAMCGAPAPADS